MIDLTHPLQAGIGVVGAVVSWFNFPTTLGQTTIPKTWWEAGPYVVFIGSLLYAIIHVWRALQKAQQRQIEMQEEQAERDRKMISQLSDSLDNLSRSIRHEDERE